VHELIHIDLPAMGDSDVRAGKPAAHVVFGEDVALLAGDALFAEAITLIFHEQQGDPTRVLAASAKLMHEVGVAGLVGGVYADRAYTQDLDADDLRRVYELKTDHLLAAAVETVLILTRESGLGAAALRRFGAAVGVLSQIAGDILDAIREEQAPRLATRPRCPARQEHLRERLRPAARTRARQGLTRARERGARGGARRSRRAAEPCGLHPRPRRLAICR